MFRLILIAAILAIFTGCSPPIQSASGAKMATVGKLPLDEQGHTAEQRQIIQKTQVDADPNQIWHIYIISPFDRQIILHSSAKGKVTSSGKRLTPQELSDASSMTFTVDGLTLFTHEMPSEDGTFGSSAEYIYWTDTKGRNRRHYLTDGQIIHVVDQELSLTDLLNDG
jgi:hypothetical protein